MEIFVLLIYFGFMFYPYLRYLLENVIKKAGLFLFCFFYYYFPALQAAECLGNKWRMWKYIKHQELCQRCNEVMLWSTHSLFLLSRWSWICEYNVRGPSEARRGHSSEGHTPTAWPPSPKSLHPLSPSSLRIYPPIIPHNLSIHSTFKGKSHFWLFFFFSLIDCLNEPWTRSSFRLFLPLFFFSVSNKEYLATFYA